MAGKTGLNGPFVLTVQEIDRLVARSIGAYACGYVGSDGVFYVEKTGRSDDDVNGRLKDHVGRYRAFQVMHYATPFQAFQKECELYHFFRGSDDVIHPARPAGTRYKCPVAGCNALD